MVQTEKEFIIIPKCTIAMLSNPHSHKKKKKKLLSNPHGHFFPVLITAKKIKKIKKKKKKRRRRRQRSRRS